MQRMCLLLMIHLWVVHFRLYRVEEEGEYEEEAPVEEEQ
jgi:hypothetical protein